MNIVYSSDENYVPYMGVSMYSLLDNNKNIEDINFFVLSNGISEQSKEKIREIVVGQFCKKVSFVDFEPYKHQLQLNMEWSISLSSYARLFLCEMLPNDCDKVIYIDCDTIICESLLELWNTNLKGMLVGGVIDTVLPQFKYAIGLKSDDFYINAGVLLIDLKMWREENVQTKFIDFITKKDGQVSHHDQGTINGVLHDRIIPIDPKYNSMTPYFTTRYENLFALYHIEGPYYLKSQVAQAKKKPVIIHFVPEFVGRVWEQGCKHPVKKRYFCYLNQTCWRGIIKPTIENKTTKMRLINYIQCKFPICIQKILLYRSNMEFRRRGAKRDK